MKTVDILKRPVRYLKGVGPKRAESLRKLGISTLFDLLKYLPSSYEDKRFISMSHELRNGERHLIQLTMGAVSRYRSRKGKEVFSIYGYDENGGVDLVWFNMPSYIRNTLQTGKKYYVYGKAELYRNGFQMTHPEITPADTYKKEETLLPLYGLTAGITVKYLRKCVRNALEQLPAEDYMPRSIQDEYGMMPLTETLRTLHFPPKEEDGEKARKRLAFDELAAFNAILINKRHEREVNKKEKYITDLSLREAFQQRLPFKMTQAQEKCMKEAEEDLRSGRMMYRLLQGDVGTGKTVIAAYLLYLTVKNRRQGAFMAPTGILAMQQYKKLDALLEGFGIKTALLTGGMRNKERKEVLEGLENGDVDLVVGTHALIYDKVRFCSLDMVIVDEQHKFGVSQRKSLLMKGNFPNYMIMTATPIPRTALMLIYGDMELSIIDEYPPGRGRTDTYIRHEKDRSRIFDFIEKEIKKGRQAYVVCPFIESEESEKSVKEMEKKYTSRFGGGNVAILHGRMDDGDKKRTIDRFMGRDVSILISTTVIEVGIDSPNANIIVVEQPERFGLSQLHQLRGRIGRGKERAYCILIAHGGAVPERLEYLKSTHDGFEISEMDLRLRGGGEILGLRQHGQWGLSTVKYGRDFRLIKTIRERASSLMENEALYINSVRQLFFEREQDAD